MNIVAPV